MVIGSIGTGKSTLCNFFFKEAKFKSGVGPLTITRVSNSDCCVLNGSHFKFIDTPGFGDGHDRVGELGEALLLADNKGVHAIAICINMRNRFTADTDGGLFEELEILGNCFSHAFVVCTNGGIMGNSEKGQKDKLAEWLNDPNCPKQMKNLFESVQNCCIIVESENEDDEYYQKKSAELLTIVQQVYEKNYRQLYTNKLFTWAKEKYHKLLESIDKEKLQLSKLLDEKTDKINNLVKEVDELENKISHGEDLKSNLETAKQKLMEEITSTNKSLEEIRNHNDKLSKDLADKTNSMQILQKEKQKQLEEKGEKIASLCQENEQRVKELENKLTGQKKEVQRLQREVEGKKDQVVKKDKEITSLRQGNEQKINELEKRLTGKSNEVQELQRKFEEKEKEVRRKDKEITSLRQENKRLEEKNPCIIL